MPALSSGWMGPLTQVAVNRLVSQVPGFDARFEAMVREAAANGATYDAIGKRYGLIGKTFNVFSKLRGGMQKNVTIELKAVN